MQHQHHLRPNYDDVHHGAVPLCQPVPHRTFGENSRTTKDAPPTQQFRPTAFHPLPSLKHPCKLSKNFICRNHTLRSESPFAPSSPPLLPGNQPLHVALPLRVKKDATVVRIRAVAASFPDSPISRRIGEHTLVSSRTPARGAGRRTSGAPV